MLSDGPGSKPMILSCPEYVYTITLIAKPVNESDFMEVAGIKASLYLVHVRDYEPYTQEELELYTLALRETRSDSSFNTMHYKLSRNSDDWLELFNSFSGSVEVSTMLHQAER